MEVEWHFNAPAWPSAGGIWEAAVKSMKHHLKRVLGEQKLTFEDLTTLLTKIEACLNSRPLCPLTEDPDDFYNYLTPGHFLTGSPTMSLPLSDYSDVKYVDLRRRWQLTQHMLHKFWKSWSNDYLNQLQIRSKWNKPTTNMKKDDIVLVRDNNLAPGKWAMGRVLELHPGADGFVRVTTVKTQTGIIKRPVVKLIPLPVSSDQEVCHSDLLSKSPLPVSFDQEVNLNKQKPNKRIAKKQSLSIWLTVLLSIFLLISGSHGKTGSAQIVNFEPERPIYYDPLGKIQLIKDEWTLLISRSSIA